MIVRGPSLAASMSQYLIKRIEATENITCCFETTVERAFGETDLDELELKDVRSGEVRRIPTSTLFVFIGASPRTDWLEGAVARDSYGFIITGRDLIAAPNETSAWKLDRTPLPLETSVPGVFAAGDVRHGSGKRVAAAVGEGSMSVMLVWEYRALLGL